MGKEPPSPLWKKLNLKNHDPVAVIEQPDSFRSEIESLGDRNVVTTLTTRHNVAFALIFVQTKSALNRQATAVGRSIRGDAVLWFAYPKKSSKIYHSELSRDEGWEPLGSPGFEGVRQVAIDHDWSALRFRRVEYIKELTRHRKRRLTG